VKTFQKHSKEISTKKGGKARKKWTPEVFRPAFYLDVLARRVFRRASLETSALETR
jgi:hypothetical protein